mmetsp:Transcript_14712/g.17027  ORF Transcript_14712/g.17027 Transcript_14712/m.17027 type:complete len:139 (+) Transcript_14712:10-426(+)
MDRVHRNTNEGINDELLHNQESEDSESESDEDPDVKFLSMQDAIEQAGGFGKFQCLYVPLAGIGFIANGFFIYNLNYLTLLPEIMCPDGQGGHRPCIDESVHRKEKFCTSDGKFEDGVYINEDSYRSLTNWISDMDMY